MIDELLPNASLIGGISGVAITVGSPPNKLITDIPSAPSHTPTVQDRARCESILPATCTLPEAHQCTRLLPARAAALRSSRIGRTCRRTRSIPQNQPHDLRDLLGRVATTPKLALRLADIIRLATSRTSRRVNIARTATDRAVTSPTNLTTIATVTTPDATRLTALRPAPWSCTTNSMAAVVRRPNRLSHHPVRTDMGRDQSPAAMAATLPACLAPQRMPIRSSLKP